MKQDEILDEIVQTMLRELHQATIKFGKFRTKHEGYAVILEELDELFDVIKQNGPQERLVEEAIQVGAMAIRFVYDLGGIER